MGVVSLADVARKRVYLPWTPIPPGRMVELPGRGAATWYFRQGDADGDIMGDEAHVEVPYAAFYR